MRVRSFALIASAMFVLGGCGGAKKAPAGPPPLVVDVGKVMRRDIATTLTLDGQIAPLQESTLSTPESGTVARVLVNEGDHVATGQLLADLDASQLRAQLAANEATVRQNDAKLSSSNVQAPISSQQYASALSQAQQALLQARNRVQTAEAAERNAHLVYQSDSQLAGQGYVSQTALVQARANDVSAAQEVNNARQSLPAAEAALATARTNTGQTRVDQATIEANRAALAEAQANVKLLQTQIAQSSIYAPFEGVVTERLLDPGAFAGPNQAIVRVSQVSTVYVNANVPDDDLAYVRPGTPASFTSPSVPGKTFAGAIVDVNATPTTGTLSYRARLRQPNPGNALRGGMLVSVHVVKERRADATVVSRSALFEGDQGSGVYTVVDGKAKLLPVKVGLETDTLAEVSGDGVSPGTTVITTKPDALQDGSVVAVNNGAGAAPKTP